MKLAAILCLVLAANIAYADDDVDVATYRGRKANTALDIIENEPSLSILAGLIRENNLTAALDNKKRPVTVFAPTNQALTELVNALPNNTDLSGPLVTNILLQHVTRSKVLNLRVGRSVPSLNPGNRITRVNPGVSLRRFGGVSSRSSWSGGQGNVVNSIGSIKALKAAVIIIDGVLLPNNAFASIEAAAIFYNYTAFAGAVVNAGLLDAANDPALQKTVFAPSNSAFEAVAPVIAQLNDTQLSAVLTYHVSPEVVSTPFTSTPAIPTLLPGQTLGLVPRTTVVAANSRANVVTPNIYYPGGVFQGINAVLVPDLA